MIELLGSLLDTARFIEHSTSLLFIYLFIFIFYFFIICWTLRELVFPPNAGQAGIPPE